MTPKENFERQLKQFVTGLRKYVSAEDGQWTVKGFIDVFRNVYTISFDTKVISMIIEFHLFPKNFCKLYYLCNWNIVRI